MKNLFLAAMLRKDKKKEKEEEEKEEETRCEGQYGLLFVSS